MWRSRSRLTTTGTPRMLIATSAVNPVQKIWGPSSPYAGHDVSDFECGLHVDTVSILWLTIVIMHEAMYMGHLHVIHCKSGCTNVDVPDSSFKHFSKKATTASQACSRLLNHNIKNCKRHGRFLLMVIYLVGHPNSNTAEGHARRNSYIWLIDRFNDPWYVLS